MDSIHRHNCELIAWCGDFDRLGFQINRRIHT
jgi:hypothetical protein